MSERGPAMDYDHSTEDIGNLVGLEHVNVRIPDQRVATTFYAQGLGLTRDPEYQTGTDNMWMNVGRRSQFHLPTGRPQVLRGHVGLLVPDLDALLGRLAAVARDLDGTAFSYVAVDGAVSVTSPWGNRLRCVGPGPQYGEALLGMPYVELEVPPGAAAGIARFYETLIGTRGEIGKDEEGTFASCVAGPYQRLRFRETDAPLPAYDGHHIQVYLADFSGPHEQLAARGLVTEENGQFQYRFKDIVDPETNELLYTIEHEVRSMTHPMYGRPLYNA